MSDESGAHGLFDRHSFRLRIANLYGELQGPELPDDHVKVTLFAGPDPDHRANCGSFIMRRHEADALALRVDDKEVADGGEEPVPSDRGTGD